MKIITTLKRYKTRIKYLLFFLFIVLLIYFYIPIANNNIKYINNYIIPKYLNFRYDTIKNKINISIYTYTLKGGGRAKMTAILLYYLAKIKIFDIYLFTDREIQDEEYNYPKEIKRIIIINNLFEIIEKTKINILIYELKNLTEMQKLNNLENIKVIYYHHSSLLGYIYARYFISLEIYKVLMESKYVINLIPFENDYLFKKWGIKSIFMNNFLTYDFNSVIPSDLSSKIIVMIGRAGDIKKRFDMGIKAMKYIIKEIPECMLKIISKKFRISYLQKLIEDLKLERNIKFEGFKNNPKTDLQKASLHFFPTLAEASPLVLIEAKIFGSSPTVSPSAIRRVISERSALFPFSRRSSSTMLPFSSMIPAS